MLEEKMPKFNSPAWAVHIDDETATGLIDAVSQPRLGPYGLKQGQPYDSLMVVARHARNIALSESLYPVLHMLEIVLRNRVHDAFTAHFRASDWFDQDWIRAYERKMVSDARNNLAKKKKPDTPDNIVAALSFGFWCSMFNAHYETGQGPWPVLLKATLPQVPKPMRMRKKILERLEAVRKVRNRVFHHEPIFHLSNLPAQHRDMIELLGWFSPEARNHVSHLCRFEIVMTDVIQEAIPECAAT